MTQELDKSALSDALEAYWTAGEAGTDKGIEAAIVAYMERIQFRPMNRKAASTSPLPPAAAE